MDSKKLKALAKRLGFSPEELNSKIVSGDMKDLYKPIKVKYDRDDGLRKKTKINPMDKYKDTTTQDVFQTEATTEEDPQERLSAPQRSVLSNEGKQSLINQQMTDYEIQEDGSYVKQKTEKDDDYLFPSTEYEYTLQDLIKTSNDSYKKAKSESNPFSSHHRNQLF